MPRIAGFLGEVSFEGGCQVLHGSFSHMFRNVEDESFGRWYVGRVDKSVSEPVKVFLVLFPVSNVGQCGVISQPAHSHPLAQRACRLPVRLENHLSHALCTSWNR